jgi:hypothetical protein
MKEAIVLVTEYDFVGFLEKKQSALPITTQWPYSNIMR